MFSFGLLSTHSQSQMLLISGVVGYGLPMSGRCPVYLTLNGLSVFSERGSRINTSSSEQLTSFKNTGQTILAQQEARKIRIGTSSSSSTSPVVMLSGLGRGRDPERKWDDQMVTSGAYQLALNPPDDGHICQEPARSTTASSARLQVRKLRHQTVGSLATARLIDHSFSRQRLTKTALLNSP